MLSSWGGPSTTDITTGQRITAHIGTAGEVGHTGGIGTIGAGAIGMAVTGTVATGMAVIGTVITGMAVGIIDVVSRN